MAQYVYDNEKQSYVLKSSLETAATSLDEISHKFLNRVSMENGSGRYAPSKIGDACKNVLDGKASGKDIISLLMSNNYGGVVSVVSKTTNKTDKKRAPNAIPLLKLAVSQARKTGLSVIKAEMLAHTKFVKKIVKNMKNL